MYFQDFGEDVKEKIAQNCSEAYKARIDEQRTDQSTGEQILDFLQGTVSF